METKQVLSVMKVFSWIIFIGLSIKAGSMLIASIVSFLVNPEAAKDLYQGLNLYSFYQLNVWYYISILSLMLSIAFLKAHLFYVVIKIFSAINLENPFSILVQNLILKISYVAFGIGVVYYISNNYIKWLITHKGCDALVLDSSGSEFLFMAGILFIIAYVFKRGVEIQDENELTV